MQPPILAMRILLLFLLWYPPLAAFSQDPDLETDERSVLEDIYRSSDGEGEVPTGFGARRRQSGHKRVSVPPGGVRVGCICMDDTRSATQSIGACSGHGGVRYWLYRTPAGDTARVLTARHERHPHPLTEAERSELVQPKAKPQRQTAALAPQVLVLQPPPMAPVAYAAPSAAPPDDGLSWSETAAVGFGGGAVYALLRFLLGWSERNPNLFRYALRHFVRPRRRPAARKNGQGTAPPRG